MSSMAIRIWIALNFLTVFLQYFLQYFFASFFECFITTALRSRGKGEKGKRVHTQRTFATILHFDGAFRVTCTGRNYFAVTRQFRWRCFISHDPSSPSTPFQLPLHFSEMFYCRVNLCSYLLPLPIEGPATAAHLPNATHTHAHLMPCHRVVAYFKIYRICDILFSNRKKRKQLYI